MRRVCVKRCLSKAVFTFVDLCADQGLTLSAACSVSVSGGAQYALAGVFESHAARVLTFIVL